MKPENAFGKMYVEWKDKSKYIFIITQRNKLKLSQVGCFTMYILIQKELAYS